MIRSYVLLYFSLCLFCFSQLAIAQAPVVNTTISIDKTGSEPFDPMGQVWTPPDLTTAGLDDSADNNVTRLQDSVTYKVEVSLNDAPVGDLTAEVNLIDKQVWIEIPTGCKTDPADVTAQPVSSISADGTTLFCNLGPSIEGTTKVFFPAARVVGVDPRTGDITLNNSIAQAEVSAGADGNNMLASDGPTQTIVTAFFRVDTIKEPKVNAIDPDTGGFIYKPVPKLGPNGEAGTLMEYRITARYVKGSMIADSDEMSFEADYDLFDFYTDDNLNNNMAQLPTPNPPAANPAATLTGPFSTGGILYTWDAATPACSLDGNHGVNAAVTCLQPNATPSDFTASNAPIGGYLGDLIDDPTVEIDLDAIDVRDPDADGNLFEVIINIWFNNATDIQNHQGCVGGTCVNTVIQDVATLNAMGQPTGFNPQSTEDASMMNLLNYNGVGEPTPNRIIYPMSRATAGPYASHKTFDWFSSSRIPKENDQFVPAGSVVTGSLQVHDHRLVDQSKTQICDKIDTSVYELKGLGDGSGSANTTTSISGLFPSNIGLFTVGDTAAQRVYIDASPYATALYSNLPHTDALGNVLMPGTPTGSSAADANAANLAWHTSLQTSTCPDDLNGDGTVNIKPAGAPPPDPMLPVDWYEAEADIPGGVETTTRFRGEVTYDKNDMLALKPAHNRWFINFELDFGVKLIPEGYGDRDMLPNWMSSRRTSSNDPATYEAWTGDSAPIVDLDEANWSVTPRFSDRNILVASGHSVAKYTEPRGIKVVRAGDIVKFVLEPKVFGIWPITTNTAQVVDNLPNNEQIYQAGSEEFSFDAGATWLTRADLDAAFLAGTVPVSITTPPNAPGDDPIDWTFGSVDTGEQLPLIRYDVLMDPSLVADDYDNTVTIVSDLDPNKSQRYRLTILPEFGLDVFKNVGYPVFEVNEPFTFDLTYKNLGGEPYQNGQFIDILPYIGDGSGTTSGKASDRDPESDFSGLFDVTDVIVTNAETVSVTTRAPAMLSGDPCHEDNLAPGYVPGLGSGDLCEDFYYEATTTPAKAASTFAGGGGAGTGLTTWVVCTGSSPLVCPAVDNTDITAVRFDVPTLQTTGGRTVSITLEPDGNLGGDPNLDALDNVTTAATGDIYTNTFGGRIPNISLNVISNDVSVTMVDGSIGNYVWWDAGADGVQENDPIAGVNVELLDTAGSPIFIDPATGAVVSATYPGAMPYTTTTNAMGEYLFENLPSGDYQVRVTPPPAAAFQTYDFDGVGTANISSYSLMRENDAFGRLEDVEDEERQDFGYARNPVLTLVKVIDDSAGGTATLADFPLTYINAAGSLTDTGASGTPAVTDVPVPPDTYFLSEPAVLDYTASDFVCVGGSDTDPSDGITLALFDEVTCTVTNTYVPPPVPEITVTKAGTLNNDGTIDYTITVTNSGTVDVLDIEVTDPLITTLTYSALDDIDNDQDIDLLAPGDSAVVTGTYMLTEANITAGEVENQASAEGVGPRGQPAVDDSDSENPVDDTGGEDDPTVTPLPSSGIGVAKDLKAGSPVDLGNGSYQVTYEFVVTNTGSFDLTAVQLTDDLQSMINTPNPNNATYASPVVSSPNGSLTPNPSFNGSGNLNMLTGTDTLLVGEVGLLELTFVFTPDVYFGPFENQAQVTAEGPGGSEISDLSEDGPTVNPDTDSPTPFAITTPSTPITLGWFTSRIEGGYVVFEWATEVEVSNAGFTISALNKAGEWQQINPQMIPSRGDSVAVQRYEYSASSVPGTTFRFSDVSITGRVVNHGPYELGVTYGALTDRKATDWNDIERESDSKQRQREQQQRLEMQERLNQLKRNGPQSEAPSSKQLDKTSQPNLLVKAAGALLSLLIAPANAAELVSFEVEEAGLYRVTHAQLLAQGLDLSGIDRQRIGLKQGNRLWPMQVYPKTSTQFSTSSYLLFPGSGVDTLYTGTNKYVLVLDEGSKQIANDTAPIPQNTSPAPSYLAEATYAPQNHYTHISPSDKDSWYADSLKAISGVASKQVSLTIDEYAPAFNTSFNGSGNARMPALRPRLELSMWGNSDFPGNGLTKPDHLIQVDVNDERVRDVRFDGLHLSNTETVLTNLQAGSNSVSLTLPKTHGYRFDLVNLDRVSLRYPRRFKAQRGGSSLEFSSDWNFFRIFGLASNTVAIVRVDNSADNEVQAYSMTARGTGQCSTGCVYFTGSDASVSSQYFVATGGGFRTPAIKPLGARNDIFSSQAKYLIISHPDFIATQGLELESYASQLAQQYGSADIVDVSDIYAHFSGHVLDANAIHAYIKQAYAQRGTRHAMLVGGDMYDYRNHLGTNARSFIPSLYVPIAMNVNAVPSDSSYADIDGDYVPDITITRLPVRNTNELVTLMSKRQSYLAGGYAQTAMFAADKVDGSGYSFKADAQKLVNDHFGNWAVDTAYVDDVSISQGKAQIISALGAGAALTSYSGHSSTDRWSISGLFTGSDVTSLTNNEKPTVVTQWGCWNTFYTSPEQDSLAHRLLVENSAGAVTVMGATSFTKADAEQRMADLLFARLKQGLPIGEAVLSAKQALAAERPYQLDVLLGWTVLGPDDMAIYSN